MTIFYVDYEGGNDSNNGLSFANRKKTINSAVSSTQKKDEIRVMASPPPTSVGNATWFQQPIGSECAVQNVYDESGSIRIKVQLYNDYYPENGYIIIKGSTISSLNGIWKISVQNQSLGMFILNGSNFSSLGVSDGSSPGSSTKSVNISGKIVSFNQELISSAINPPSWNSYVLANPITDWVNIGGSFDGVSNGSSYYPGSSTFRSIPQSSWRITWNATNTDVTVTEYPYVDNRNSISSWSNRYSSYYGSMYSSQYIGFSYNYRHIFAGYNSYYARVNGLSYVAMSSYTVAYNITGPTTPSVRHFAIGARNTEMYNLKYKSGVSSADSTSWSDLATDSAGYAIWYKGNRTTGSTIYNGVSPTGTGDIEWTMFFFGSNAANKAVHIDIHNNIDWVQQTIQPGVATVPGFYDNGTKFSVGGSPANTTLFWHDFSSTLDLSAYDSISFFLKAAGSFNANEWKVRIHENTYTSSNYVEFNLDLSNASSDFTAVNFNSASSLPNNVGGISIVYTGSQTITSLADFTISNFAATSSTGINFSSIIGRNTADSLHWYKVAALRYINGETLITLASKSSFTDESEPGSLAYYGNGNRSNCPDLTDITQVTSDTVPTYVRVPIDLSTQSSGIVLAGGNTTNEGNKIRGGWNRTDMSTQDGITMFANSPVDSTIYIGYYAAYLENFYCVGAKHGYEISGAFGTELVNCHASYTSSDGFYIWSSNTSIYRNCSALAANGYGIVFNQSGSCDVRDMTIDGCTGGVDRGKAYSVNNDTYDCVIRGNNSNTSTQTAFSLEKSAECVDYNPFVLAHGNIYYCNDNTDCRVYGGRLRHASYKSNSQAMTFYNYSNGDLTMENMDDTDSFSYYESGDINYSDNSIYAATTSGEVYRYWQNNGVFLRKQPNFSSGTLPDGSVDPGNTVFYINRGATNSFGLDISPDFNLGASRIKLGDIPCSTGGIVTVSVKIKDATTASYARTFFRCDSAESTIGLSDDILTHWKTQGYNDPASQGQNGWVTYSQTITVPQQGIAACYMYITFTSTSSSSYSGFYLTDLEITAL